MKKAITLLALCLAFATGYAQYTITGKITDEKQKPVKAATVLLLHQKDSTLVLSALSDAGGNFSLSSKEGKYFVAINMLGYKKSLQPVTVTGKDLELPETKLQPAVVTLGEVTVTATKPFLEQRADKLVVNIEGSATAAGSTAMEVLQKVPGVIIRNEQVTLAGKSSVNILIDGKSSQYTDINQVLASLSASNIEKIELISNPGAKYDAAGGAIINIILKKTANLGTNGTVQLTGVAGLYEKGKYGVDRNFYRYSPSFSLNHRKGKLNIFGSASYVHRDQFEYMELQRLIQPNNFLQATYTPGHRDAENYRAGLDFYADSKNTIGVLVRGFHITGSTEAQNTTQQLKASTGDQLSSFKTFNNTAFGRNNIAADLNWKHVFDTAGRELNIDFDYSSFHINNTSNIVNSLSNGTSYVNNQLIDNPVRFAVFKLDYTHPFNKDSKMELGGKISAATIDNYLTFRKSNVIDLSRSTDFEYSENINALYGSFQRKFNSWELNMGLRAEQTVAKGKNATTELLNRDYWQLFPSIFLTKRIDKNFATVGQYTRRVNRPGFQQQNPFIQYLDSLTYTRGNPYLKPEVSDAYKFLVTYQNQPFFSISYNRTADVIFQDAPKQEGNLTYTMPENLAAFENVVFELNFPIQFGKKISGFGGNQFIYNHYKADYLGSTYNRSKWNWQAYWQVAYKPRPGWNIEVSGFYTTNFLNEFIEIGELGNLNLAIQRVFMDKKARLTLNFNDLLFSQRSRGSIQYQDINVLFRQANETRNVRLTFSYSFGNQKLKAVRNRSTGSDAEANRVKTN
ncbi:MAG: TonB-dependent receptor [Chitinophagaceae bacterium]|nr:TonB-dependent receptor [Chitinophagaceae bacterium]